jgi:hypothetical protein
MRLLLFALALLVTLPGCSVMVKTPMTRFESPEARGKPLGFDALMGYQGRNEIELTPNYRLQAPSLANPSVEDPSHHLMAAGNFGLLKRLDISLTIPSSRIGLKFQPLGDPKSGATSGNFPVAISAGLAYSKEKEAGNSVSYSLRETLIDLGLIFGYRFTGSTLIYASPSMQWDRIRTSYSGPAVTGVAEERATAKILGFALGLQQEAGNSYLRLEAAGAKTRLGQADTGRATFGIALGKFL